MKNSLYRFFVLQAHCNPKSIKSNYSKRKWSILTVLIGCMLLMPFSKVQARGYYESDVTFSANESTMTIKFLGINYNYDNDELDDLALYYLNPNDGKWVCFYHGDYEDNNEKYEMFYGPNITNYTIISKDDLRYVELTYNYPKELLPSYAIIKAEVDWDEDSNNNNTGIDNTFYYTVKGMSEIPWKKHWILTNNSSNNKIDFQFLICDVYGDEEVAVDKYSRNELDDIVLEYSLDGINWISIFHGDCDNSKTYKNLEILSGTDINKITTSVTRDANSDRYIGHVTWSNIPSALYGKTVKFRRRADWDLFADQTDAGFDAILTEVFNVTIPTLTIKPTLYQSTYSSENETVILKWNAGVVLPIQGVKYYITRSLKNKTTGGFENPTSLNDVGVTTTSYTDATISHWNEYRYTVYAVPTSWGWTSDDKLPEYSSSVTQSTNPPNPTFNNLILTAFPTNGTITPHVKIEWKNEWVNRNTVKLYHRASTTMVYSLLDIISPGLEIYIDDNVTDNSKHFYKIVVDLDGKLFEKIDSITVEKKVAFNSINATKNTIGDRIQLSWEIDRLDLCDRFEIYRSYTRDSSGVDISTKPEMVNYLSAQTVYNKWDDMTAVAGVVYTYKIKAFKKGSDGETRIKESPSDIGFRTPIGTISGRITYNGGTSVDSVSVYVESSSLDDNMLYKSLNFKGENSQKSQVNLTNSQHGCLKNGFSFQSWLTSSRTSKYTPVFEVHDEYSIGVRNDSVLVYIGIFNLTNPSVKCKLDSAIKLNNYFHLSVTLNTNDSLKIYINGKLKTSGKLPQSVSSLICTFSEQDKVVGTVTTPKTKCYLGSTTNTPVSTVNPYNGNIDDVRLWSRGITATEVLSNFNRYLSGSESGLIGYWPLDEGINSYAFDCSKTNQKFNEHHIQLISSFTSSLVPTQDQLSIKGLTDADGNYIIRGIPFTGSGSTYSIRPVLGTHSFEPNQLVRYISPSSLTHNSSDFTDKSSFKVKVKVTYQNTNYPVKGVSFLVDENPCLKESKLILTGDSGIAVLDVPIGMHYIKAQLNGHGFEFNGRYPAGFEKRDITQAFAESTIAKGISFIDTTTVILAGRVAGGIPQSEIALGFGRKVTSKTKIENKSKANIGQATITLYPAKYKGIYSLNHVEEPETPSIRNLYSDSKRFNSIATIENKSDNIVIKTDPETGEYMAKVPPIEWTVGSVLINGKSSEINILENNTQTFTTNPLSMSFDTLSIENDVDTFKYNVKRNFIYRVNPTIEVSDVRAELPGAFGERDYSVYNQLSGGNDTILLYADDLTYKVGNPVFVMGKKYRFKIKAFERYFNYNSSEKDSSDVSLSGASVVVENAMGKLVKSLNPADPINDSIPVHEMSLNKSGFINYEFLTGFPNLISDDHSLGMKVTVTYNEKDYYWDRNDDFSGIVLGSEPIDGTNFVTEGPLVPLIVLRDPPGSNSYAYLETGTSISYNVSNQDNFNRNMAGSATLKLGADVTIGLGMGAIVINDSKWTNDTHLGYESDYASFTGTSTAKSLTLTERIETSGSPDFIGSNGDVYIGTSTNVLITESNVLDINKEAEIYKGVEQRSNIKAKTEFRFSQNEILTAQIPMWRNKFSILENGSKLLNTVDSALFITSKDNSSITGKNQYITYLDSTDPDFGMNPETYAVLRPSGNAELTDEVDSIASQIRNWQNVIRSNEETKFVAKSSDIYEGTNISFDAGSTIERSYTYSDENTNSSGETNGNTGIVGTEGGLSFNGFGIGYSAEVKIGSSNESSNESSTGKTTTFGYVLSDPDLDNRFSINVYKNKFLSTELAGLKTDTLTADYVENTLGSYIFATAGGQTSCPYERVDSTLFYKENNNLLKLGDGTQAIEAPFIRIQSNTKSDVPTGKDATYILELSSGSIVPTSRAYILTVDDTSNPDGAIISIDGTPLTEGRLFYVAPGDKLTKTLTLRQTKQDVLEYKGIKLLFSSPCDNSVYAEDSITAIYVPSCSDLDLAIDNRILNSGTGTDLELKMTNFNQVYKNFLGLSVEYKMEGETNWHGIVFAKNERTNESIGSINGSVADSILTDSTSSSVTYPLSFDGKADGNYLVRAKTLCRDGINIINNITPEFEILKDMVKPTAMGQPSPSNGVLTPENEISVTFNEDIQIGKLIKDNFEVKGVLNGVALQHAAGLSLDGTSSSEAFTESSITLQNSSFAIEAWIRTADDFNLMGNVFTIGTGADKLMLNMKKDAVEISVDEQIVSSSPIAFKSDWQYISMTYDATGQKIQVHLMSSSSGTTVISEVLGNGINPTGRLMVGNGFIGNINEVVIWNENRTIPDLSDMNGSKSGKETNIVGYWPMDEAYGTSAADKVRNRNMTVKSSWFVEPNGYSASFDGNNQSLLINTATIPLTNKDNFSLEFWFKGNSQTDKTIFSCGKGINDIDSSDKLSVGINEDGKLIMNSKDASYIVSTESLLDASWHHFALSVKRNGNSNIYVDGNQKFQISSSKIGGLASDSISLGSRRYSDSITIDSKKVVKVFKDQYFVGMLDEVRIWNSALGAENFRLDMRSKLTGTESGLIAYYPFEETTKDSGGILQITPSFNDCSPKNSGPGFYCNESTNSSSAETPGIKVPRPKEDVSFSFTGSDNKIIFNIDAPLAKIENCILEFAVNEVSDLNGNNLGSPIKWTAFVNNNRLNWETEQIKLTKEVLEAATFTATIINNSGSYENYLVDGLPGWLSVNKSSGRINPLEKTELLFTVDNATNVGSYESRIMLTGNNNIQEMLPVSLIVTGPRPDWTVNPYDYESSMNITGQIKIEGVYQEDAEDVLAAFIGTKCVGIVNPQFNKSLNGYLVYMDVYGNGDETGLPVTFSLWDAGTGRIYPDVDVIGGAIQFVSGAMLGSIVDPTIFNATDKVEQQLTIKKGWNWISTNVVNTNPSLIEQVKSGMEEDGLLIKSKSNGYIEYAGGSWDGALNNLNQKLMYLLKAAQPKTLKIVGATAKSANYPVTINPKWNWIGYVPQFVAPVQEALNGLSAKEGDQIKGRIGFATYSGGRWNGSLEYLLPGLGYMYYSKNSETNSFYYPSQYISMSRIMKSVRNTEEMYWSFVESDYQSSMTVTAIVEIDNVEITNTNLQLGVFIDDVCRGTVELMYSTSKNRYFAYLSVWGNTSDLNKKITFKSYDPNTGKELVAADKALGFVPDNIVGSTVNPYLIGFSNNLTNSNEMLLGEQAIYPNPVVNTLHFNYKPSGIELFEIIDCTGRILNYTSTINKNSVNVEDLVPGIYTLLITYKGENYVHRFIKN